MHKVAVIVGSIRKDSHNKKLARALEAEGADPIELGLVEPLQQLAGRLRGHCFGRSSAASGCRPPTSSGRHLSQNTLRPQHDRRLETTGAESQGRRSARQVRICRSLEAQSPGRGGYPSCIRHPSWRR